MPGEGPAKAPFMLVGEQPGDKEDLAGKPFIGPAGRMLDRALQDAGIAREETFVTNAGSGRSGNVASADYKRLEKTAAIKLRQFITRCTRRITPLLRIGRMQVHPVR